MMAIPKMKPLTIGNITAKLPIIQGGMGIGISKAGLAAAVANEGGIGVLSAALAGMLEPDLKKNYREANIRGLKKEIQKARSMTQGILGVNIMVALTNFADMVRTAVDEGIDCIFVGAGLPVNLPQYLPEQAAAKLVPIVSSARAAALLAKNWVDKFQRPPDAVVVEGPEAGGHLGFKENQIHDPKFSLDNLLAQVLAALAPLEKTLAKKIPVIAAGGIYTGADIHRVMQQGAAGVQMATRFVTTVECDASDAFKQAYINAGPDDLKIIKSPVGMPGRVISNSFVDDVEADKRHPFRCPYHCIITCKQEDSPYCIALALFNAQKGRLRHGFAFAGSNAYRADRIITVRELMAQLQQEYAAAAAMA